MRAQGHAYDAAVTPLQHSSAAPCTLASRSTARGDAGCRNDHCLIRAYHAKTWHVRKLSLHGKRQSCVVLCGDSSMENYCACLSMGRICTKDAPVRRFVKSTSLLEKGRHSTHGRNAGDAETAAHRKRSAIYSGNGARALCARARRARAQRKKEEELLRAAARKIVHGKLLRSFESWANAAALMRRVRRFGHRLKHRHAHAAFDTWVHEVDRIIRMRRLAHRIFLGAERACWTAWVQMHRRVLARKGAQ